MRRNPENSIFSNYFKLENGNYFTKYIPNNFNNLIINNTKSSSLVEPITNILSNLIIPNNNKLNNLDLKKTEESFVNKNLSKDKECLNQTFQKNKDSGNKNKNNIIQGSLINLKKNSDFLNFNFEDEEKNNKKSQFDMNESYLTKLLYKTTITKTDNELKSNLLDVNDNLNTSLTRTEDFKNLNNNENNLLNRKDENQNTQKKSKQNSFNFSNTSQSKDSEQLTDNIYNIDNISENFYNNIENSKINSNKITENSKNKNIAININREQVKKHQTNLNKNTTKTINKTGGNNETISNLHGILLDLVKSDKEKSKNTDIEEKKNNSFGNIIEQTTNIIENNILVKNSDNKTLNCSDNIQMENDEFSKEINENDNLEDSIEEIILNYDSDFFNYDFQEKSFYEKPKNQKNNTKSKDDKLYFKNQGDRNKDREKERDKTCFNSKFSERNNKKYSKNKKLHKLFKFYR